MSLKEGHRSKDKDIPHRRFTTESTSSPAKWGVDDSLTSINNRVAEQALEGKSQRHRVPTVLVDLLERQTRVLSESMKDAPIETDADQSRGEIGVRSKKRRVAQEGLFLSE